MTVSAERVDEAAFLATTLAIALVDARAAYLRGTAALIESAWAPTLGPRVASEVAADLVRELDAEEPPALVSICVLRAFEAARERVGVAVSGDDTHALVMRAVRIWLRRERERR